MKTEWKSYKEIAQDTVEWMMLQAGVAWRAAFVAFLFLTCPLWLPFYAVNKWYWEWTDRVPAPVLTIAVVGRGSLLYPEEEGDAFTEVRYGESLTGRHFSHIIVARAPLHENETTWLLEEMASRLAAGGTTIHLDHLGAAR